MNVTKIYVLKIIQIRNIYHFIAQNDNNVFLKSGLLFQYWSHPAYT